MKETSRIYGQFAVSTSAIPFEHADQILGCQLVFGGKQRPDAVRCQYQTAENGPVREVRMDYLQALFLLSCLKSMQLDCGTPFPDDPRG